MVEHYSDKIDKALQQALDKLADDDVIEALVYPERIEKDFLAVLAEGKNAGDLQYNLLHIANCVAIKAPKRVLLTIAARPDVLRLIANPRFMAQADRTRTRGRLD